MSSAMEFLKQNIPARIRRIVWPLVMKLKYRDYQSLTTQQIFSKIYDEGVWGRSDDVADPFYSGAGSRDAKIVEIYVEAVANFLKRLDKKPDVVDLGCGDFSTGSAIRSLCGYYTACDIVPSLIAFNKNKYERLKVDFRILDLSSEPLPDGEIVFIKEVLQHLSNDQIKRALFKIKQKYKYLICTEELPRLADFKPNIDKPAGPNTRLGVESGIVLSREPFNLDAIEEQEICEIITGRGLLRTIAYQLR